MPIVRYTASFSGISGNFIVTKHELVTLPKKKWGKWWEWEFVRSAINPRVGEFPEFIKRPPMGESTEWIVVEWSYPDPKLAGKWKFYTTADGFGDDNGD